jgi:hypothetical protein
MANEQYLQGQHIPTVVFQNQGNSQSVLMPDWLNARYVDMQNKVFEYVVHIVTDSDLGQPDAIAYRYYEDSNWWWIICSYNGVINPIRDMFLGQRLRIPVLQQVQLVLQQSDKNNNRIGQTALV